MSRYALSHLSDAALLSALHKSLASEQASTADVLAHLAEVDERRLYLPAGYPSMFAYCVGRLGLSEDAAAKRIQVARAGRRFPAIFPTLAQGRLHLTGVGLLAPHLTPGNVGDLLAAAASKTKAQIEQLLAERFPSSELLPLVQPLGPAVPAEGQHALAHVGGGGAEAGLHALAHVGGDGAGAGQHAPAHVGTSVPPAKVVPIAPERYALQVSIGRETHELLCQAQALLGHSVPSGDLAGVLHHVLKLAVGQLERQKFGATSRPQRRPRPADDPRHIPAAVKRAVWRRDGGRCTFVSADGHRCEARSRLEFDHAEPVAKGGQSTVGNLRLRCHAHNQHAAEQAFGAGFMAEKRRKSAVVQDARGRAEAAQARADERAEAERAMRVALATVRERAGT